MLSFPLFTGFQNDELVTKDLYIFDIVMKSWVLLHSKCFYPLKLLFLVSGSPFKLASESFGHVSTSL